MSAPRSYCRHRSRCATRTHGVCIAVVGAMLLCAPSFVPSPFSCLAQNAGSAAGNSLSQASSSPSATRLKADLQQILSSEEYRPESNEKGFVTRMLKQAREHWERLRKWFANLFRSGSLEAGGTTLIWVLVILMGGALGWIAFQLLRDWRPARKAASNLSALAPAESEPDADIIRDPAHWLALAQEYAEKQDYRRAYRALFLAALLKLEQAETLSFDRARTNGDYIRALRSGPNRALYETLLPPAQAFDRFWYGQEATQAADYRALMDVYAELPASSEALIAPRNRNAVPPNTTPGPTGKAGTV